MPYNFVADSFHTKKHGSKLSSSEVRLWTEYGRFAFLSLAPLLSGLPISVNWMFFTRCCGWSATREYQYKIDYFTPMGASWPKISGRMGRPISFSSQNTTLNDLSYGLKIWTDLSSVLSQYTLWQTDRILITKLCLCSMQGGKNNHLVTKFLHSTLDEPLNQTHF